MTKLLKDVDIRKAPMHRLETTELNDEPGLLVEEVGLCPGAVIVEFATTFQRTG
jgi:hypothetical protein